MASEKLHCIVLQKYPVRVFCLCFLLLFMQYNGIFYFYFHVEPSASVEFNISTITSSTATLVWNPISCRHQNGEITHYVITVCQTDFNDHCVNYTSNTTTYTVTRLTPRRNFTLKVVAVSNQTLPGNGSQMLIQTLPSRGTIEQ